MLKKYCKKCKLELPPDHKKSYCGGSPRHACWCNDKVNQWRLKNKIITRKALRESFFGSIASHIII